MAVLLCLSMQSCIVLYPRFTPRSPEVVGRIIDSKTGLPVSKATVSGADYRRSEYSDPAPMIMRPSDENYVPVRPQTLTKPDGTFRLPRTHNFLLTKVFFAPCSGSIGDQTGTEIYRYLVQANGYRTLCFGEPPGMPEEERFNVGTVKLVPLRDTH